MAMARCMDRLLPLAEKGQGSQRRRYVDKDDDRAWTSRRALLWRLRSSRSNTEPSPASVLCLQAWKSSTAMSTRLQAPRQLEEPRPSDPREEREAMFGDGFEQATILRLPPTARRQD